MKFLIYIKENSTRVSHKNFVNLNNKPLWSYLIDEIKSEDVYVDTDSEFLINELKNYDNITAYSRADKHKSLETDKSFGLSPVPFMIERFLESFVTDEHELIVTPHVTSPFLKLTTIKKASTYIGNEYDSVQACTLHQEFAYFRNQPINFNPTVIQKTQDLEPIVLGNGAFFIFTKYSYYKNKSRTGKNPFHYPLNYPEFVEIDNDCDLKIAASIMNYEAN